MKIFLRIYHGKKIVQLNEQVENSEEFRARIGLNEYFTHFVLKFDVENPFLHSLRIISNANRLFSRKITPNSANFQRKNLHK